MLILSIFFLIFWLLTVEVLKDFKKIHPLPNETKSDLKEADRKVETKNIERNQNRDPRIGE